MESQVSEIAQGARSNQDQLASLFDAVEHMRSDLAVSDEQTRQLAKASVQMEGQAETISQRLAQVGLDDYHQRIYDLAREGARLIAEKFEADIVQGRVSLMTCLIATTNPSPIPHPPALPRVLIATPIKYCRHCKNRCFRAMKVWYSLLPARSKVMCRRTTTLSVSL